MTQPINSKEPTNDELFIKRFVETNEKLRKMLPDLHDIVLSLAPFTDNKINVTNAWTNFKQMDGWIGQIMKDGYDRIQGMEKAKVEAQVSPVKREAAKPIEIVKPKQLVGIGEK